MNRARMAADQTAPSNRRSEAARAWRPWYGTKRWKDRRAAQLRAEPLCCMCAAVGKVTVATVADHRIPHKGDPVLFWEGELQSMCAPHHDAGKQKEEAAGFSGETGPDGWPSDPRHPANARGRGGEKFRAES